MKVFYILIIVFVLLTYFVSAYEIKTPNYAVHQYITQQSCLLLDNVELQMNCLAQYNRDINSNYDAENNDDLVVASGEEDKDWKRGSPFNHFWNPDAPFVSLQELSQNAVYDSSILFADSSYRKAMNYWQTKVIPLYLQGDKAQSYYYLGRVSHLLEDAAQPSHMHLDTHLPFIPWEKSRLESYTADKLNSVFITDSHWQGKNYVGQQYDYTNLIPNFDWNTVRPSPATDKQFIELFNLFWYTAQKTQYFASDDVDGNMVYTRTDNGQSANFNCNLGSSNNLWYRESFDCNHIDSNKDAYLSDYLVEEIANTMIPHAMKANGALFELFWDTVNSYSWPTFHGNNQRTGYSFLKGDLQTASNKKEISYNGKSATDFLDSPAYGNLDSDEKMEIVVGTATLDGKWGRVFAIDDNGKEMWSTTITLKLNNTVVAATPEIADLDGDGKNEVIFGDRKGRLFVLDGKTGKLKSQKSTLAMPLGIYGENKAIFSTAIADVDNNGKKDIVFSEFILGSNTLAKIHAYKYENNKLSQLWETEIGTATDSSGSQYHPAVANIDTDVWPEIIIDSFTQIYVFDGKTGNLQWNQSLAMNFGSPVIADIDDDGKPEIIVNTYDFSCPSNHICTNATNIINLDSNGNPISVTPITAGTGWSPYQTPAVANLDSDDNLEIVSYFNNNTKGKIVITDGKTFSNEGTYTDSGNLDFLGGSPVIVDVDPKNSGKEILAVTAHNKKLFNESYYGDSGKLIVLSYDGSTNNIDEEWNVPISAGLYGSPAVGDYDNDNFAEVIVTHAPFQSGSSGMAFDQSENFIPMDGLFFLAPPTSNVTFEYNNFSLQTAGIEAGFDVVGGINKKPLLDVTDEIFAIAGDEIQVDYNTSDDNNDTVQVYFSSPFNNSGYWNTTINDTGNYYTFATAIDGNLSETKEILTRIFKQGTTKLEETTELNFSQSNTFVDALNLENKTRIYLARAYLTGYSTVSNSTAYQNNPYIIQINSFNSSDGNLTDNNWSSYYSAGSLTGAIVEQRNLIVVSNPRHILFKLRLKVGGDGHGRFGVYDYNNSWYDIVTSTIKVSNSSYEDYYFEVYDEEQPFLTSSDNTFLLKVTNVSSYLNGTSTRWYYRYIDGDYYDQRIYESAVELASQIITPFNITLNVSNQTHTILNGSLHTQTIEQVIKLNETVHLDNSSKTYNISIPKGAKIESVLLKVGDRKVTSINATSFYVSENLEATSINEISSYVSLPSSVLSFDNGTTINISAPMNVSSLNLQAFCNDWDDEPGGSVNSYIKHVYYGPYCANEYTWHTSDVDSDGYDEWYMLKGETYGAWFKCTAETAVYSNTKVNTITFDSDASSYNAITVSREYTSTKSSTATSISYPQAKCDVSGSGGSAWYEYYGGDLFGYWDANNNSQYDVGEHTENYLVLNCAVDNECATDKYCNTYADNNPLNNVCSTPSCSGVSLDTWESYAYANHVCIANLSSGRCNIAEYNFTNLNNNQYCNSSYYPSSDNICQSWQDFSVVNHQPVCTLKEGRCDIVGQQLNTSLYCDSGNYIAVISPTVSVENTFSNSFFVDDNVEVEIGSDIQRQLDLCTSNMCDISINVTSEYNISFNVTEMSITYVNNYVDISDEVQTFVNSCVDCDLALTVTGNGGIANYSTLVYYANNTAPSLNTTSYSIYLPNESTIYIDFTDIDGDQLDLTVNSTLFVQSANSLIWSPQYLDSGNYTFNVTANDGIETYSTIINVEVLVPQVAIRSFRAISNNNTQFIYEAIFGNYLDPISQSMDWNLSVDGIAVENSTEPIILNYKTEGRAYFEYNFSELGINEIIFTLYNENYTIQSQINQDYSDPVPATSVESLFDNETSKILEVVIYNDQGEDISDANITLQVGSEVSQITNISLNSSDYLNYYVYFENLSIGLNELNVTLATSTASSTNLFNLSVTEPFSISSFTILNQSGVNASFEFIISKNSDWTPFNVSWTMDMIDENITNSQDLELNSTIYGYLGSKFNSTDTRQIILNVSSNIYSVNSSVIFG